MAKLYPMLKVTINYLFNPPSPLQHWILSNWVSMIRYRAAFHYLPCTTTSKSNFRAQHIIPDLMCMKLQANVKSTLATNNIFHKKMNRILYFLTYLNLYKLFLCSLDVLIQSLFFLSFVGIHVLSGLTSVWSTRK